MRLEVGALSLETALQRVRVHGELVRLTRAEFRVLELLMRNSGKAVSRAELTRRALGRRLVGLDRRVDTHISNLRRKLGVGAKVSTPILAIRGTGYMLGLPAEGNGRGD